MTNYNTNTIELEHVSCAICGLNQSELVYRVPDLDESGAAVEWQLVRCTNCDLCYLNPRPTLESIGNYYPQNYYSYVESDSTPAMKKWLKSLVLETQPGYAERTTLGKKLSGKILNPILSQNIDIIIPFKEGGRILDIGCGNGERVAWMRDFGWDVYGLDISEEACSWARKKGVRTYSGDFLSCEFPNHFFDVVVMNHTLEHLHYPIKALIKSRIILKDDGLLVVDVPNFGSFDSKYFGNKWNALMLPTHLYQFTRETLTKSLDIANFQKTLFKPKYFYSFRDKIRNMSTMHSGLAINSLFSKTMQFTLQRYRSLLFSPDRRDLSVHLIVYASP